MASPGNPRRSRRQPSVVPYNPGLQQLVQAKNEWQHNPADAPLPEGFAGWHQRGYLPHRDEPGLIQFVTFRLADAFPVALRAEWQGARRVAIGGRRQA